MSSGLSTCVLVPDGVGVRNFVFGGLLKELDDAGDVHVFHPFPEEILDAEAEMPGKQNRLTPYIEKPIEKLLRVSFDYATLFAMDTFTMRMRRGIPIRGTRQRQRGHKVARAIALAALKTGTTNPLRRIYEAVVSRNDAVNFYRDWLASNRPDVVFSTHQRPQGPTPTVMPAILAAKALGIPTATFIFSWDNLTSKSRIAAPFDYYLVWSEHMKGELLTHYANVAEARVRVVGTPQFDTHANESVIITRREFFEQIGADEQRPLICYSTGDRETCPQDPLHIAILMDLIRSGAVKGDPQVLVRSAPINDDLSRYSKVLEEYPEIIFAPPRWIKFGQAFGEEFPTQEDLVFLGNLTTHADININMASTMTLDFAVRDKPVVNVAFDANDDPPFELPIWDYYYRFDHYRPVVEIGAARFARSPEQLAEHLNAYIADPSLDREARRRLVDLEIGCPIGESTDRVLQVLKDITNDHDKK